LAQAMISIFAYGQGTREIGIRAGEKMHETLISSEELLRTEDCGDYFRIHPEFSKIDYRKYYFEGNQNADIPASGYTSENAKRLSREEMEKTLLSLEEIQKDLKSIKK
jgi:UDP-glucose 4-epimerase